jgi:hypothetical protein
MDHCQEVDVMLVRMAGADLPPVVHDPANHTMMDYNANRLPDFWPADIGRSREDRYPAPWTRKHRHVWHFVSKWIV